MCRSVTTIRTKADPSLDEAGLESNRCNQAITLIIIDGPCTTSVIPKHTALQLWAASECLNESQVQKV